MEGEKMKRREFIASLGILAAVPFILKIPKKKPVPTGSIYKPLMDFHNRPLISRHYSTVICDDLMNEAPTDEQIRILNKIRMDEIMKGVDKDYIIAIGEKRLPYDFFSNGSLILSKSRS